MSRKMTAVFRDEDLYTNLKVEAERRREVAGQIVLRRPGSVSSNVDL